MVRMTVPKSHRLEVSQRSTSDEFPSRVIIGNCRLFQYGGLFQKHYLLFTNNQATWLNQTWTLLDALPVKNTLLSLSQGNFAKFSIPVSFTLVDLQFLVQPVGSEGAYKILPARVTACIFRRLCPIFITVCSTFDFSALQISLTLLGITFYKSTFTFIFLFGLLPLANRIWRGLLPARGTACILSPLCPIFITVSTTSDFSALQISLTLIFHKSTFTSIFFIWSSTSRW